MKMREHLFDDGKRKKNFILRAIFIPILIAGGIFLFGEIVMLLWNAILPQVTGVRYITYWQAVGILVLAKILFGGYHGIHRRHNMHDHRNEIREKWNHLSPEEREKLRDSLWNRFESERDKN